MPRPGPTLLKHVATDEMVSSIFKLLIEIKNIEAKRIITYTIKYPVTDLTVSSSRGFPSTLTLFTDFGLINLYIVFDVIFDKIMIRIILNPPPVEPAQAPTNINRSNIVFENPFHKLKSAVQKPVVLITDTT